MSLDQSVTPTQAKKYQLPRNAMQLFGRIDSFKRQDKDYTTYITLPSVDEFSKPQTVQVNSKSSIGQRGDVVEVLVGPAGFLSKFSYADKNTGEKLQGEKVVSWFELIE